MSRRNVAEMFGNVGRRVSNLTTRQLALIDAVERGETDPALLERLYSIDHIAVRLRRNADSLMLLAGIRETVLDAGPTALTNVVRAALGQIEGFQRVRLRAATEAFVEPDIIGDLTLMIAELLENAVSFSPEDTPVEVVVGSDEDGASVTVSDHGLGMSAERLAEENARLVRRERLDLVPTKVLGLFVVGALARRWDVDVTLTRTPGGGVTAEVMIPSTLLVAMSEAARPSGPVPRVHRRVPPPPGRPLRRLPRRARPPPPRSRPGPPATTTRPRCPAGSPVVTRPRRRSRTAPAAPTASPTTSRPTPVPPPLRTRGTSREEPRPTRPPRCAPAPPRPSRPPTSAHRVSPRPARPNATWASAPRRSRGRTPLRRNAGPRARRKPPLRQPTRPSRRPPNTTP